MSDVRDAVLALLSGHSKRQANEGPDDRRRAVFAELAGHGWTRVGLPEDLGGHGGTLAEAAEASAAASYLGVASPLVDQVLVANSAAGRLGIAVPREVTCLLPVIAEAGRAAAVPWASWATHLLVADRAGGTALVPVCEARVTQGSNLAGLPSDTVKLAGPIQGSGGANAAELLMGLGALARSVQIAAALRRCQDLSATYVRQRRQFGKTLADLPVVLNELAALAGETVAAEAASRAAIATVSASTGPMPPTGPATLAIAAAKVRTGLAATTGARSAHQIHGAMGITREYELHVHTLSMWAWRDEYGAERGWARRLGAAARSEPGGLWANLVPVAAATRA
jgi:acyl-CoA dehydrogenase